MRNVHIISHTHWDREWYRTYQLFRLKLIHMIDGVLDLLEKDPDFKYFMLDGQTIVLDDYLAMRPEQEPILRRLIEKGRIIIGPWHILPDTFLVGPEAHIRNLLQGDRTARKFGAKMSIGYIPDPFGHPGQIPQILQGFGIDTSCLWRGLDEEPTEFWWQSPDGSRVLMAYLRDSYSNGANLPTTNLPAFAQAIAVERDRLAAHSQVSDYLVMLGTDHMEPPAGTSKAIDYAKKELPDTRVIHSTLPRFVASVKESIQKNKLELPVVIGELRQCRRMHLLPGVLSTRMWIKQRNFACEDLLLHWVEPFTTFASILGSDLRSPSQVVHPAGLVRRAWRMLMENHPHDSICGCSIDQVHDEMKIRFDQVDQVGEEIILQSLETLAVNTSTATDIGRSAIVVFNPSSFPRTDVVNASIELPPGMTDFDLVDSEGTVLPYQNSGFGSRELINMTLSAKDFRTAFSMVVDGRAANLAIEDLAIRRDGEHVYIEALAVENGEPNLPAWKIGRKQVDDFLVDPTVSTFHVRARTAASTRFSFMARSVPAIGYQTLWARSRASQEQPVQLSPLVKFLLPLARIPLVSRLTSAPKFARPPYRIENEYLAVEALSNGTVTVSDKRTGTVFTDLNRFVDGGDCGDEYNYAPPANDTLTSPRLVHVRLQNGPVQRSLELELTLKTSGFLSPDRKSRSPRTTIVSISSCITLSTGVPRLDIHTTVHNAARDHRLRVHFPAPFTSASGFYDGHFEVVERKIGIPPFDNTWIEQPRPEVPQRIFTDITDGRTGLMLANRGLPEVEVLKNSGSQSEIALTLLRCVGWLSRDDFETRRGHAGPALETPGAQMTGEWSFDYSFIPHSGDWQAAFKDAYAFATPLRAVGTALHDGVLPPAGSFVTVEPSEFVVTTIKTAESEDGWIVRGCNLTDSALNVVLKPWRAFKKIELVDLAEQKRSTIRPQPDGSLAFKAGPHQIITVKLTD